MYNIIINYILYALETKKGDTKKVKSGFKTKCYKLIRPFAIYTL